MALALIKHLPSSGMTRRINTGFLKGSPASLEENMLERIRTCLSSHLFPPSVWLPVVDLICLMLRRGGRKKGKKLIRVSPKHFFAPAFFFL